jgi:hypothetical protein
LTGNVASRSLTRFGVPAVTASQQFADPGLTKFLKEHDMLKWWRCAAAMAVLVFGAAAARADDSLAVVTILEGDAVAIRGASKYAVVLGMTGQADDIFETLSNGMVRLEYADGTRIDLGPSTRIQLNAPTVSRASRPALYALDGWIKISVGDPRLIPPSGFASPQFDVTEITGSILARIDSVGGATYVEQGRGRWVSRREHEPSELRTGNFISLGKDGHVAREPRPADDFVAKMPRAFRDAIPPQMGRFRGKAVVPHALEGFSYAEVEPWLNSEPSIRRQFVSLWRVKAEEPDFRLALAAKLNHHPEWGPVLFPALFAPKPTTSVAGPSSVQ